MHIVLWSFPRDYSYRCPFHRGLCVQLLWRRNRTGRSGHRHVRYCSVLRISWLSIFFSIYLAQHKQLTIHEHAVRLIPKHMKLALKSMTCVAPSISKIPPTFYRSDFSFVISVSLRVLYRSVTFLGESAFEGWRTCRNLFLYGTFILFLSVFVWNHFRKHWSWKPDLAHLAGDDIVQCFLGLLFPADFDRAHVRKNSHWLVAAMIFVLYRIESYLPTDLATEEAMLLFKTVLFYLFCWVFDLKSVSVCVSQVGHIPWRMGVFL